MRSFLFVPGDSESKLKKALSSGADALILDLEDSVALDRKVKARELTAAFLESEQHSSNPRLLVRINPLDSSLCDEDLEAVMPSGPSALLLPKTRSGQDVNTLANRLSTYENSIQKTEGTGLLVLATETPISLLNMASYINVTPRLEGLTWGAEDLSAALGATTNKDDAGAYTDPYRLARSLCLYTAAAANVPAIDTVYTKFKDIEGLRVESLNAARDGFTGKLAIHPAQVPIINEVFTPSDADIARAKAIVAAFQEADDVGVVGFDGEMLDRPHLLRAQQLLKHAKDITKP